MGFDVHGMNPQMNTPMGEIYKQYSAIEKEYSEKNYFLHTDKVKSFFTQAPHLDGIIFNLMYNLLMMSIYYI